MTIALSAVTLSSVAENQLAFPGAQGWGRYAMGARAASSPTVYHVTNLNDSGTGSFRDAVSQANRIVVFDVSGIIRISSRISFAKNLYVAGQTAPGEGVTIYGDGVSFSGADNLICRYLRVRMGSPGTKEKDCAGISNGTNMIFDHCSFSWGKDETFSINPDGKGDCRNFTLQYCIFGQGLMDHSAGGLMQADSITLYRNFYIDNNTRNNKVKGINQYANNVVYNWSNGCYIMGGDSEGKSYVNIESNLFINGPSGGGNCFGGANADFHCYGVDNWQDSNKDGVFNPSEVTNYSAATRETTPYNYPKLDLYPGNQLLEKNIPMVGASLPYRDQSDYYLVEELMSLGKQGGFISNEATLPIGTPDSWSWWSGEKIVDTDGDGMPDVWEEANGTDKSKADATVKAANGYLNIENYINSITAENRQYFLRQPINLSSVKSTTTTVTLSWRDYTYEEDGFEVEYAEEGSSEYQIAERAAADVTSYVLTGLKSGTFYNVRVRAYGQYDGDERYSNYATALVSTRPVEANIVDIDSYVPDVTNSAEVAEGQTLLWHTDEELSFAWEDVIKPSSVVATGKGTITVSGNGAIGGESTSMNKGDAGTLILNNKNSYEGATIVYDGVLEFNSIANGGTASAIGASKNFAQNWIFDGGTYRYTGGKASTDRNAQVKSASTLEVKSAALTLNGTFEGQGDLTFAGGGSVEIPDTTFFAYTGATRLEGKLYLSTVHSAKKGIGQSSKLVMAGGTLQTKGESASYETYSFPIEVAENTYSYYAPNRNCYIKNRLSGTGTLEFKIPYVREYFDANVSSFNGRIVANGISTEENNSIFMCSGSTWNMQHVPVTLKGNTCMAIWNTNGTGNIGGISGDASTQLIGSSKKTSGSTTTWNVGSANTDEEFRGVINNLSVVLNSAYNGTTSINKVGSGYWRLTGNNVYSGTTTVTEGTLIVNGKHTGSGAVRVLSGATLMGKGSLAGKVTVENGATLCPGDTLINDSNLKLTGVSFANGSTLRIPVSFKNNAIHLNAISLEGNVSVLTGATLELDLAELGDYSFEAGDALPVFRNSIIKTGTGSFKILPATPGEGLEWETSTLLSDGMLRVKFEGEEYQGGKLVTEERTAVLEHTYSVQGGSNAAGTFMDQETHYYNNWGSVAWVAQFYTQFSFDLKEGEELMSAQYTIMVNCGGSKDGRALDVNYMPAGTARVNAQSEIPALTDKVGTAVASYTDIKRSYATKQMNATNALAAMAKAGQNYIQFIHSNGAAGGQIYGKGSSANAPKLTYTVQYTEMTGIVNVNDNLNHNHNLNRVYDMQGNCVTSMVPGQMYVVNGKKVICK